MPKGSRIVDINGVVHDVENFVVAVSGEAKVIGRALVAEFNIAREFWPPTTVPGSPIVMDTVQEVAWDIKPTSEQAVASVTYDARTGRLEISQSDGSIKFVQVLNPAARAQGLFLFRVDVNSGTVTGTTGVWIDVNSDGTLGRFPYTVVNSSAIVSQELGDIDFSIALDSGGGVPDAGSIVIKPIDYIAELTGTNLTFTEVPWFLEDIRVNENASVILLSAPGAPQGFFTGNEHAVEVIREVYAQIWNIDFTVQVDIVSGALTGGDATGVALSTDVIRTWNLDTITDEDLNAVVDVTYSDGIDSITKRVTMHSEQTKEAADSTISTDFVRFDRLIDNAVTQLPAPINEALALLLVQNDGQVNAQVLNSDPGGTQTFPQNWNDSAPTVPDPENFETMLHVVSGDAPVAFSDPLDVWLSLNITRSWGLNISAAEASGTEETFKQGRYEVSVRVSGSPGTIQTKTFEMIVESIVIPEGGLP